ncbi:MAG TPA: glycosyltransferase [Bacteroidales bacterium]|nr:glycosyltransferase [Bacteroidales bacterium]
MKIRLFYHSILSDWNHGNAHFLRGIVSSLHSMGNDVQVFEPEGGWSLRNLLIDKGYRALDEFFDFFPFHHPVMYNEEYFKPSEFLNDADLVIVHEWNTPQVVKAIGDYRSKHDFILLFHDTHHRSVTAPREMVKYDLHNYDGVLAFGEVIRSIYLKNGWSGNVWTWHEAADDRIFHPVNSAEKDGDLVWIGNWGDDERTEELMEFIIRPVVDLGLKASFYGVRYPADAITLLKKAKIRYEGWLPNYKVPEVFGRHRVTVHVPRRPYVQKLPGIPTIRPFEAMSCGIPMVSSPWEDSEKLFTPGEDFLVARNGDEMKKHLTNVLSDKTYADELARNGLRTIRERHTCDHRARDLMGIISQIESGVSELEMNERTKY